MKSRVLTQATRTSRKHPLRVTSWGTPAWPVPGPCSGRCGEGDLHWILLTGFLYFISVIIRLWDFKTTQICVQFSKPRWKKWLGMISCGANGSLLIFAHWGFIFATNVCEQHGLAHTFIKLSFSATSLNLRETFQETVFRNNVTHYCCS